MYCLRWWIPLFLFPFPKTSPFFLILFIVSFTIHSKPCMYCALIITGLITTSGNWYSSPSSTSHHANTSAATKGESKRISYSWLDLGTSGGNGFWRPTARPEDANSHPQAAHFRIPLLWTQRTLDVPKRFFVGLGSHGGMGVWIDLSSDTIAFLAPDEVSPVTHSISPDQHHSHKIEL